MFWFMIVTVAFTTADGQQATLRFEHSQHFDTHATCSEHLQTGVAEVKAMLENSRFKEARNGTFTPECIQNTAGRDA